MTATSASASLVGALIDFHRSPGKYPLAARQPAVLFASTREVLQLASGKPAEGSTGEPSQELQDAAVYFVRTSMFYPGADHYALMGLDRNADAGAIKDRYRVLMRLIHPDFAGSGRSWTSDAAVRVNTAYEVLSSADRRAGYDQTLGRPPESVPAAAAAPLRSGPGPAKSAPAKVADGRLRLDRLAMGCGAVAAVLVGAWMLLGTEDRDSLVQRAGEPEGAEQRVAAASEPKAAGKPLTQGKQNAAARSAAPRADKPSDKSTFASAVSRLFSSVPAPAPAPPSKQATVATVPPPLNTSALPGPSNASSPVAGAFAVPQGIASTPPLAFAQPQVPAVTSAPQPAPVPQPVAVTAAAPPLVNSQSVPAFTTTPAAQGRDPRAAATPSASPLQASLAPAVTPPAAPTHAEAPAPSLVPAPALVDVQPLLSALLQQMETGTGDRILTVLDRDARGSAAAKAVSQHYDSLVEGARPVKLSHVRFKAEQREGRLVVVGQVRLHVGDPPVGSPGKELGVVAEFVRRDGSVVMARLARAN